MKKIAVLLLGSMLWFALVGCGGGGSSSGTSGGSGIGGVTLKTGQTAQVVAFDDGYYRAGISKEVLRDNARNIIIDQTTGLMWQDDSAVGNIKKRWITQENFASNQYNDTSGETAATYCNNLVLGDFADWRLPTITEFSTLLNYADSNPLSAAPSEDPLAPPPAKA